ncbi:hypothetical protein PV325_008601 [Microctonus aethiopoides]|nr:hypothetical protein PV325_008601 [Microctonus aethiopoides]
MFENADEKYSKLSPVLGDPLAGFGNYLFRYPVALSGDLLASLAINNLVILIIDGQVFREKLLQVNHKQSPCTCGGRTTECNNEKVKFSLLTNIHDDPLCETISNKGVIIYEAAKLIADAHNKKNDDSMKIDIFVMDTCGSIAGAIKAVMKALVSTGLNCIHAPYHLDGGLYGFRGAAK